MIRCPSGDLQHHLEAGEARRGSAPAPRLSPPRRFTGLHRKRALGLFSPQPAAELIAKLSSVKDPSRHFLNRYLASWAGGLRYLTISLRICVYPQLLYMVTNNFNFQCKVKSRIFEPDVS